MKALFDAIFAHFETSGPSLPLFNTEASAGTEFPYAVVQLVSGVADDFASDEHYTENWLVQFNLFDKSGDMSALLGLFATLITAFDFAALTIAGYTFLDCVRQSVLQMRVEEVWQLNVTYRIKARAS